MKRHTFARGIHPQTRKLSASSPIRLIPATGEMVYPLAQHIGAPARPVVAVGDHVLGGDLLAEAVGFVSAPVYASTSGTVTAIAPRLVPGGDTVPAIILQPDGEDTWRHPSHNPAHISPASGEEILRTLTSEPIVSMDAAAIREAVAKAGIVGLGGAGFPAVVKLTPKDPDAIDTLIVNGAECEPYLTSDDRLMQERGEELLGGCSLLLRLFPNARCVIAIENNKPAAIRSLRARCAAYSNIEICPLKAKYPQGGERMLISA
ncbi:MAG: electron transporter RnfC, partial [Clostridia bacterium]|nr:electron transporter RnfC [Clostridia bacterium]